MAARKDRNHNEIADIFLKFGWSVLDISRLKNCCDMFVSKAGRTVALEVKDGLLPQSKRKLTEGEAVFMKSWGGEYRIITSVDEALKVVNEIID